MCSTVSCKCASVPGTVRPQPLHVSFALATGHLFLPMGQKYHFAWAVTCLLQFPSHSHNFGAFGLPCKGNHYSFADLTHGACATLEAMSIRETNTELRHVVPRTVQISHSILYVQCCMSCRSHCGNWPNAAVKMYCAD